MYTIEPIEVLNNRLREIYGSVWDGRPVFRISWSEDQFEKKRCLYSEHGIELIVPEWRECKKYQGWIVNKFVLERLVAVPPVNTGDLVEQTSYEPLWVFETKDHDALPPKWEACEIVIDALYAAIGKQSMYRKYVDPRENETQEDRNDRILKLQEALFGNETAVGDALAQGYGVSVPSNYKNLN